MSAEPPQIDEPVAPKCIVCGHVRTADTYELGESELGALTRDRSIWKAARVHAKYGALPICRACFESLGFELEGGQPGDSTSQPVVIRRRTPGNEA